MAGDAVLFDEGAVIDAIPGCQESERAWPLCPNRQQKTLDKGGVLSPTALAEEKKAVRNVSKLTCRQVRNALFAVALCAFALVPSQPFGLPVPTVGQPAHAYAPGAACVAARTVMVFAAAEAAYWAQSSSVFAPFRLQAALSELAIATTLSLAVC